MHIIIYADIIFIINFFMDSVILLLINRFREIKASKKRIFAGSFTGAFLCTLLTIFLLENKIVNVIFGVLILVLSVLIAFYPVKKKELLFIVISAYILSFSIGGISMFILQTLSLYKYFSVKVLLFSTSIIFIILKISTGFLNTKVINKNKFCDLRICFNEKEIFLTALIDTGNELREPKTKLPVIIADFSEIEKLLSSQIKILLYKFYEDKEKNILHNTEEIKTYFMEIPFKSLGEKNGFILGFKPNKTIILSKGKSTEVNVFIGIYSDKLSYQKGYNAIIGSNIYNMTEV